jgi:hemoglobin-like flavoprotein
MSDVPDPATGLTKRERDVIRDTWAIVKTDIKGHGLGLFVRFFTENPTFLSNFSFKDIPVSEFKGNKKVLAHAYAVMYALTSLVDNLEDTECIVEMLTKLSVNHNTRGITIEQFNRLGLTIVGYLADTLGPSMMNEAAVTAWKKTYGVIVSVVQQGYDSTAAK